MYFMGFCGGRCFVLGDRSVNIYENSYLAGEKDGPIEELRCRRTSILCSRGRASYRPLRTNNGAILRAGLLRAFLGA